ncbi:hypothetical protein [Nocardiopsis composta]|uniref:Uncharacterized protein n=1 Tax=Nocardiopsis composta TaxID=157465 RepID=A0A7W8VBB1_9ACTN|nr:hypothetical protein [Nocardiopsis composta]MBB5429957.1 hypothetical protein [Nocardiopsis composta]
MERSREQQVAVLDALGRGALPRQARFVAAVARRYPREELETPGQREIAAAAGRTSVAEEIEERWPGAPFAVQCGAAGEFPGAVPGADPEDEVVIGVVYRMTE